MRFISACAAALLAVTSLTAAPAFAQQRADQVQAPSARQLELSRRYLDLLMTDQFTDVIHQMLGEQMAADQAMQDIPDEDRRFLINLTTELTTDMVPQMIAEMVPVYAAQFTEEELQALVDFFDTPMGRSIAEKNVLVMPEANRAVMTVVPQMLEKMASRMCQHYGCTPTELQELRRSMREEAGMETGAAPAPRSK